jgi:glycosyltransferase involved in cell wall biosynthesis
VIKEPAVLLVTTNLNYNGAKKYIVEVANELAKRNVKVGILFDSGPLAEILDPNVKKHHVRLQGLGLDSLSRLKLIIKTAFLVRREGYKIIHAESANSVISHKLLAFFHGAKVVETIHHVWGNEKERAEAVKKIGRRADKLITISPTAFKILISSGLAKENVSIIQNGINIKEFADISKNEVENLRRNLGFNKKDPVLVSVSRVCKAKNFEAFVNWFPNILSDFPNARLVIVGDNGIGSRVYLDKLIKKIKSLELAKNIVCVGGKTYIKKYLGLGQIFTLPTVARGLSVLEAMAAGLPVVARGVKNLANPEVVLDKKTGLTFEKGNWKVWAEGIRYLLSKPETAKRFGEVGKERVSTFFTIESHVDQLVKIYKKAIES